MAEMIMLIGLPASGKSSLAEKYKLLGYKIHSSDAIRDELHMIEYDPDKNNEVFNTLHNRIICDLKNEKNVVYDACNISRKKRMYFLDLIKRIECVKTAIIVATPYNECILRNNTRKNRDFVPENVIKNMYTSIYLPYYYEGWNDIKISFTSENQKEKIIHLFENEDNGLDYISQDNPHHLFTVGEHCRRAAMYLTKNYTDISSELYEATLLHDIGKPFTKSFINANGNTDTIAHYYNHNLVSAYMSLFINSPHNVDILKRAILIQWHMQPFFMQMENKKSFYRNLWGDDIYNDIQKLHIADVSSTGVTKI